MNKRLRSLCLVGLILTGCDSNDTSPSGDVAFTTDKPSYKTGEDVRATISNETASTIGFGACIDSIDAYNTDEWSPVYRPEVCTAQFIFLESGKDYNFSLLLTDIPTAEKYRLSYVINSGESAELIQSNSFEVEE
jgi:hypothetical protein